MLMMINTKILAFSFSDRDGKVCGFIYITCQLGVIFSLKNSSKAIKTQPQPKQFQTAHSSILYSSLLLPSQLAAPFYTVCCYSFLSSQLSSTQFASTPSSARSSVLHSLRLLPPQLTAQLYTVRFYSLLSSQLHYTQFSPLLNQLAASFYTVHSYSLLSLKLRSTQIDPTPSSA